MTDPTNVPDAEIDKALGEDWPRKNRESLMLTEDEIKVIAIAVRTSVTTRWSHPDWNYSYYDNFEEAVANGIRMALKKAEMKYRQATGPG